MHAESPHIRALEYIGSMPDVEINLLAEPLTSWSRAVVQACGNQVRIVYAGLYLGTRY